MTAGHNNKSKETGRKPEAARSESSEVRIGFVPLVDAAPLIAALEQGYFAEEGLAVTLHRQIGWANIRDKLTFGVLDAGHALLGMPLASHLEGGTQPLVGVMSLGTGGNAITISTALHDAGVRIAADMKRWMQLASGGRRLTLGYVFDKSMHHYLLRDWLSAGGINPDTDVRLRVIPPPQMAAHMAADYVDGFCVGEPWNTVAQHAGIGKTLLATTEILPSHPEKVLAVAQSWLRERPGTLRRMIRAVLRGCAYVHEPANHEALAGILARSAYIDQPAEVILECLSNERQMRGGRVYDHSPAATFPSQTHVMWLLTQMVRWGHASVEVDVGRIAAECCDATAYRAAAKDLGMACPESDAVPMTLRNGTTFGAEQARNMMATYRQRAAARVADAMVKTRKNRKERSYVG